MQSNSRLTTPTSLGIQKISCWSCKILAFMLQKNQNTTHTHAYTLGKRDYTEAERSFGGIWAPGLVKYFGCFVGRELGSFGCPNFASVPPQAVTKWADHLWFSFVFCTTSQYSDPWSSHENINICQWETETRLPEFQPPGAWVWAMKRHFC